MVGDTEIGVPQGTEELEAFADILTQAFGGTARRDLDWAYRQGVSNLRVARRGGRVAGGLGLLNVGQWYGGRSVTAAGVNRVAVASEYRAAGIASGMLACALEDMRDQGLWLSILYPATQPVYRKVGFEQAGSIVEYQLPTHAFDSRDRALELRPLTESDHPKVRAVYTQMAQATAGNLDRNEWFWGHILARPETTTYAYVVARDDDVEGYVVWTQRQDQEHRTNIHVQDMVAATPDAWRRLLTLFADQRSTIGNIRWSGGPAEPMLCLVANQEQKIVGQFHWMLRVVDVEGALQARGYPHGVEAEIHLEVRDATLPWNEGRWVLEVSAGEGRARRGGRGDVRLDIRGLAPLYSGHLSPLALMTLGLAEGDQGALATAGVIFSGPAPWMPDEF